MKKVKKGKWFLFSDLVCTGTPKTPKNRYFRNTSKFFMSFDIPVILFLCSRHNWMLIGIFSFNFRFPDNIEFFIASNLV